MGERMRQADITAGVLGLLLATAVFYITASFPEDQVVLVGPAFFPRLLAAGLALFSAMLIGAALLGRPTAGTSADAAEPASASGTIRGLSAFAATVGYCAVLEWLGFIPCTVVYLIFLMRLLGDRNTLQVSGVAIGVTGGIFFIFKTLLNITLPMGALYGF